MQISFCRVKRPHTRLLVQLSFVRGAPVWGGSRAGAQLQVQVAVFALTTQI